MTMLNGTVLDGRIIRLEVDKGYRPTRELGRGGSGGQVLRMSPSGVIECVQWT
jgi:hypothetical protein